jgi:hypothetical protein
MKRLIVLAAALFAVLVAASAPAGATVKRVKYSGPVDLPELEPGLVPHARIEFTLRSESKRGSSTLVPTLIPRLIERNIYQTCNPPRTSSSGVGAHEYPSDGDSDNSFFVEYPGRPIRVKYRRFSATDLDTLASGESHSFKVTGTIPRRGRATGTIRLFDHFPAGVESFPPFRQRPAHDCDSGTLNWTATKR